MKDPDRLVLSADKGNCVVVMDKHQYREKALSLLNDRNTYSILKSKKLNKMLLNLKKAGIVDEIMYKVCIAVTAFLHDFISCQKSIKREFLWGLLSHLSILRLMRFRVI